MQQPVGRRPRRFFYGWVIVAVSCLADATAFGAGSVSLGVFLQPMNAALGWSRTALVGAVTLQSFANLFVSPVIGPLVDRYGPRVIMVFGAAVAGVSYLLMGEISELWQFYLLYTVSAALGLHEVGSLVTTTVVSKWFIRMRGRALGMTMIGNNLGGIIFAPLLAFLIGAVGWRAAWAVLGLLIVIMVMPPTILFMRRTPEDMGLLPDGDVPEPQGAGAPHRSRSAEEPRWGARDALRTRTLWLLVVSFNLAGLGVSAMVVHQVAYYSDVGLSLQAASLVFALNHFLSAPAKLFWGFLAERVPVRYCMMGTFLGRTIAFLILILGSAQERVYAFALVNGLVGGAVGPLQSLIWADYYGRAFVGTIRGILAPFSLISSLGGPLFAAFVFDLVGSYNTAFMIFAGTLLLGVTTLYFAKPPGLAPAQPAITPIPNLTPIEP